ncbi:MAG: hypothetical protein HQ518_27010 [Rhodopirellula sp.]|nr:hypothetical protein [Rhodopirellula sp.]
MAIFVIPAQSPGSTTSGMILDIGWLVVEPWRAPSSSLIVLGARKLDHQPPGMTWLKYPEFISGLIPGAIEIPVVSS